MYSLMLAVTANSTSVHFGMNHLCKNTTNSIHSTTWSRVMLYQDARTSECMQISLKTYILLSGIKKTDIMG
jgi:hypothetical protein